MTSKASLYLLINLILFSNQLLASNIPDYYSEPGVHPFRDYLIGEHTEIIDPFSGGLSFMQTDMVIPGHGGLDIQIQRSYRSLQGQSGVIGSDYISSPRPTGVGWDLHFGRVWTQAISGSNAYHCKTGQSDASQNPVLELADGTRKPLYDSTSKKFAFMSKDRWIAKCRKNREGGGLLVYSPDGTQYQFSYFTAHAFPQSGPAYHVTQITDVHGNSIHIDYDTRQPHVIFDRVYFNYDKNYAIQFDYDKDRYGFHTLTRVYSKDQQWKYHYQPVVENGQRHTGYYYLTKVEPPAGDDWQFDYYTSVSSNQAGLFSLKSKTSPGKTKTQYEYGHVKFHAGNAMLTTAVTEKKVSGGGVERGIWKYQYKPGSSASFDQTIIKKPHGRVEYQHYGSKMASRNQVWQVGMKRSVAYFDQSSGGSPVRKEVYHWNKDLISKQDELHRRSQRIKDSNIYSALLEKRVISQDGSDFVSLYQNHEYGFPTQVTYQSPNGNQTSLYQYKFLTTPWILGRVRKETVKGVPGSIQRQFNADGQLIKENVYGVQHQYHYHANGEIKTITDPRGIKTYYGSYKRGVPQKEIYGYTGQQPIEVTRTVNRDGTVSSETRAGQTTKYSWDQLNRLKKIITAKTNDADVQIQWNRDGTRQTLTRGEYTQQKDFDGLGRQLKLNAAGVIQSFRYDAQGQMLAKSNLGDTANQTTYQYDVLGRLLKVNPPGTGRIEYHYLANNRVKVTDQRGHLTYYRYRSFGDPSEKSVIRIKEPNGTETKMNRHLLGYITEVNQAGLQRQYLHNSKHQLIGITHPELGSANEQGVFYERDAAGNMTSIRYGGLTDKIQLTYDDHQRLTRVNYPDANTADKVFRYNDLGKLIEATTVGQTQWQYRYDANHLLVQEKLKLLQSPRQSFEISYQRNSLDQIKAMRYPSGTRYQFQSDNLGRITRIDRLQANGNPSNLIKKVQYWGNGQMRSIEYANGMTSTFDQNQQMLISQVKTNHMIHQAYHYDGLGNLIQRFDHLNPARSLQSIGYDARNQLTHLNQNEIYQYDLKGNLTENNSQHGQGHYQYDDRQRLIRLSQSGDVLAYDHRGNVIRRGPLNYTYNWANHLTGIPNKNIQYGYDAHDFRYLKIKSGQPTYSIYNQAGKLMAETGAGIDATRDYLYIDRYLVARIEACGTKDLNQDDVSDCDARYLDSN